MVVCHARFHLNSFAKEQMVLFSHHRFVRTTFATFMDCKTSAVIYIIITYSFTFSIYRHPTLHMVHICYYIIISIFLIFAYGFVKLKINFLCHSLHNDCNFFYFGPSNPRRLKPDLLTVAILCVQWTVTHP